MNVVIWMVAGGVVGWLTSALLHLNTSRGLVVSTIIGILGAFFGGHVLAPIFGAAGTEAGAFNPFALIVAAATAAGCLTVSDMMYERFGL